MFKYKSEKGFSLAEVMVSAGLFGVLALGMNYGIDSLNKKKKDSNIKRIVQSDLSLGLKYLSDHTNGLNWNTLDFENTYYESSSLDKVNLVNWGISDIDSANSHMDLRKTINTQSFGNVNFYLDSFTLIKEKAGTNGIYFSRCVSVNDYENKKFTLQEALNISDRPFLLKEGKALSIYCAPSGSSGSLSSSLKIKSRKSDFRVMSFYYKNKTWKQLPSLQDRKFLLGSGFIVLVNKDVSPDSFVAHSFVLDDPCYRYDNTETCNRVPLINLRKLSGSIETAGVHDSGFIIVQ